MTHIETEQRNPYYIDPRFQSIQLPDDKRKTDIYHLSLHAEVTTFDNPETTAKKLSWQYEGISSNQHGETCYQFDLTQWSMAGNKKLLMCVFIPLGLFHRNSIYLPWSEELTEDHSLTPALQEYLENLGQRLIDETDQ